MYRNDLVVFNLGFNLFTEFSISITVSCDFLVFN